MSSNSIIGTGNTAATLPSDVLTAGSADGRRRTTNR